MTGQAPDRGKRNRRANQAPDKRGAGQLDAGAARAIARPAGRHGARGHGMTANLAAGPAQGLVRAWAGPMPGQRCPCLLPSCQPCSMARQPASQPDIRTSGQPRDYVPLGWFVQLHFLRGQIRTFPDIQRQKNRTFQEHTRTYVALQHLSSFVHAGERALNSDSQCAWRMASHA